VGISVVRWLIAISFAAAAIAALIVFRHAGWTTMSLVIFAYLAAMMTAIAFLLDYPRMRRRPQTSERAKELAKRNLLISTPYFADRAFRVHESHEEDGPHYFLELEDGGVLHLCGAYLYEYEPGDGAPRHFPCTRFTVRRHAESGQVVDLLCGGTIIEPEDEAPPFRTLDFARGLVPCDGEVFFAPTFDELLQRCLFRRVRLP